MKVKVEVVKGQFGHFGLYVADQRVAGEKPWGGGQTVQSFNVDVDTLRKALDAAIADAAEHAAEAADA